VLLGRTADKLERLGVQTVGVVATRPERARLYLKHQRLPYAVGADADLSTHRAYGLPRSPLTEEVMRAVEKAAADNAHALGIPVGPDGAYAAVARADGYAADQVDAAEGQRHQSQITGQFLVGADGIVRWTNVECARDGLAGIGRFPPERELLAAARAAA
jgi:hypothetical protein